MMLGAIYGDIAGSIYEFHNVKQKNVILFDTYSHFTDDTVMTVAVAEALMICDSNGSLRSEHGLDFFRKTLIYHMHKYGRFYPGAGYGGRFQRWLTDQRTAPYNSYGNGSAMRVSPVGWVAKTIDEALRFAKASAEVTHNHPEGIQGAQAVAGAIFLARTGATKEVITQFAEEYYDLDFSLDEIRKDYRFDATCKGSVPHAIKAFLEATSFEVTVRTAISIGGDSDTIASIAASIAEAYYGMTEEEQREAIAPLDLPLYYPIKQFRKTYCRA